MFVKKRERQREKMWFKGGECVLLCSDNSQECFVVSFLVLRLSNSKCWNSFRLDIDIYLNARVGREGVNLPTNVNNLNLYNCNGCTNEKEEEYLMRKFSLTCNLGAC